MRTIKEIVVVYQTQTGTLKTVHLSAASAVQEMISQTKAGAVAQQVYEREPQIYTCETHPELY